jgi:hypothetical protein
MTSAAAGVILDIEMRTQLVAPVVVADRLIDILRPAVPRAPNP